MSRVCGCWTCSWIRLFYIASPQRLGDCWHYRLCVQSTRVHCWLGIFPGRLVIRPSNYAYIIFDMVRLRAIPILFPPIRLIYEAFRHSSVLLRTRHIPLMSPPEISILSLFFCFYRLAFLVFFSGMVCITDSQIEYRHSHVPLPNSAQPQHTFLAFMREIKKKI
jgi:hypothetical protein